METLPPRFSPDNSEEARARRIARHREIAYDHALAWVKFQTINNVIKIDFTPKPPPENICA